MKETIRDCRVITPQMLENYRTNTIARASACLRDDGRQFEHLMEYRERR